MPNSNFKKEKMSNSNFKKEKMSNVLVVELLFKVIYIIQHFFLNNKEREKCRTKRKKCQTKGKNVDFCNISIRYFYLIAKKGKNVEQEAKMSTFQNFYSTFFPQ